MRTATIVLVTLALATTASGQAKPVRYDVDRTPFVEIGGDGTGGNPIVDRVFSATKTTGGFVVGDSRSSSLLFVDAKGKLQRSVGRQGQGPGEFNGGIFVSRCATDSLIAWDSRTNRISVFTATGTYVRQIPAFAMRFACSHADVIALLLRPTAVSQGGAIPGERMASIKLVNLNGDSIGGVASVRFGANQMFAPAASIAMRGEELYVGTGAQPSIEVYDRRGRQLRRITFAHTPVRTSAAIHERAVDGLMSAMPMDDQQRARQRAAMLAQPIPAEFPPYRELAVAPNGIVWLLTSQLVDSVAHLKAVSDDGSVVAEVDLTAGGARLLEAGDDYVLLAYENADGDTRVGAFRTRRRPG